MKIICAGAMKTGTKSMREALEILGYKNVHDIREQCDYDFDILYKALVLKSATKDDFIKAYTSVDAFTDMPGNLLWKEILEAFPDTKVILTIRDDPETWLESFRYAVSIEKNFAWMRFSRLFEVLYNKVLCPVWHEQLVLRIVTLKKAFGCKYHWRDLSMEKAKLIYIKHNEDVIQNCPKDKLLVFNLKEGWEPLAKFLGKPIPNVKFPWKNVKHNLISDVMNGKSMYKYDGRISRIQDNEKNKALLVYFTIALVFISIVFWKMF